MQTKDNRTGRSAIIYTHSMIAGSMTFIKSHAEALRTYTPIYAGAHRINGLPLPSDRFYVVNGGGPVGRAKEYCFREFGIAPGFIRMLRKERPAIVHTHFGTCGPSGMALANKLDVPLIVTFHGKDATMSRDELESSRRGRKFLRDEPELIRRTDKFIAVSEFIRQRLLERGYPENKLIVHKNGIDLEFFKPNERDRRSDLVVFVGRFTEKKGIEYLIRAAAKITAKHRKFELVLIGDGPLRPELEKAAAEAKINCRFPGFLPLDKVRQWVGQAACVAAPSVVASNGDCEGLPTILLEAQAMKTPVVTTFHSGIPEGVRDGQTAYLVPERDVDALADRIDDFLASPDQAREFGEAGRQFMLDKFDLRKQVDSLEKIYDELVVEYARP
jgi:colanic acid/amylovoran biosynthesis glycosyltransferase